MTIGRLKNTLRLVAQAALVLAVLSLWVGFLIYTSTEWIDRSVLDNLRGQPKAEVIRILGEPASVRTVRGMDGKRHEYLYYSRKWGLPLEYELIFDAKGRLSVWSYDNFL